MVYWLVLLHCIVMFTSPLHLHRSPAARSDQHPARRRVVPFRLSFARTFLRDRQNDPLLPAAAALFVPFVRRCCTPSFLSECIYDVRNNFGYSYTLNPIFCYVTNQLIMFLLPVLEAQVRTSNVHVLLSPSLFHSLPRSSPKCSCMLHYCSSVSRPSTAAMMLDKGGNWKDKENGI